MTLKERLGLSADPIFLMDGTAFLYRGFYANRSLMRSDGFPTSALLVVTRILLRILRQEKPGHFLFVMDGKGKNFRSEIYSQYKANREAMPEELALQVEPVKRMVDALGLRLEVTHGCEADDCIASLSARFAKDLPVIIVSGDKDLKQCLAANVFMWDPGAKEEKILSMSAFEAETGFTPAQWPDVQALVGDSSDNIPGVPGIGPKTASQIFAICPTLEAIRDNLSALPPKIQAKLAPHLEEMFTWRKLTTLKTDAFPDIALADLEVGKMRLADCGRLAEEFEMFAARREMDALWRARNGERDAPEMEAESIHKTALPAQKALEAENIADLPDCQGKVAAILWPDGPKSPPRIALCPLWRAHAPDASGEQEDEKNAIAEICQSAQEFIWRGKMADLCKWLNSSAKIVVADLKSLMTASPSWRALCANYAAFMDLGLASWLMNPDDGDYSWPRISARFAGPGQSVNSAALALVMAHSLEKSLAANGLTSLYENLELPLAPVLAGMEEMGIAIDPAAFRSFLEEVQAGLDDLAQKIFAVTGTTFNLRSSQQLAEMLFHRLNLPGGRKTKGGQLSTSQLALEKLAAGYPVVDDILQYRKLEKMRSTYLDPLPRLMDGNNRLHTTFNQEATATGRLSSSDPNLQNIPVRGELGRRMRACFVAEPGRLLVAADYSQIELRLLADFSQDEALLEAFRKGVDIHARTAALIFDLPEDKISGDQRRMAKTINFGLLYGMGAAKLAQELKISTAKAKDFIERYFESLAGLRHFYDSVIENAQDQGYVTTLAGRKRWLPGIASANGQIAAQARRQAVNTVIQGSAADVIKLAMLAVADDKELAQMDARLALQIHDELLLEAPESFAKDACRRTVMLMENVRPGGKALNVPLVVDGGLGKNWAEAHG